MKDTELNGQVVLVTGAAQGIGEAVVWAFAARGATVAAIDRNAERLHETVGQIDGGSGRVWAFAADVSDSAAVNDTVKRIEQELGPLMVQDVLGASALEAGLMTFPEALGLMLASRLVPWSYRRLGPRRLAAAAFANVQPPSMGRASALFTVQNRLGSALGLAVLASMLAALGSGAGEASAGMPNLAAYRAALLAAAVFLLAAAGFALRIRDADAAATLHQAPKGAPSGKPAAG